MSQVWVENSGDSHLVSVTQTIIYTASTRDTGFNISCIATQILDTGHYRSAQVPAAGSAHGQVPGQTLLAMVQQRSVTLQVLSATALRNSGNTALVDKV